MTLRRRLAKLERAVTAEAEAVTITRIVLEPAADGAKEVGILHRGPDGRWAWGDVEDSATSKPHRNRRKILGKIGTCPERMLSHR